VHEAGDVTFIRDDWKAPLWGMSAAIRVLATARASRRILIIGTSYGRSSAAPGAGA